ncbi:pyridoxal kinase PdxY [Aliirhizobium terrae]|uniref:pyridoxal kinase PdxY n=1 Tax=Terrirhizobium terrae TaxID=2926709 RepID=UPI00257673E9|nr:pyridoxal kinase PdxY [Rhizobium sp. CC-CFT758]WJH39978.1 pyridoxal kinase PdxY [Rhizobium sp. CC-CFT758]
MKQILSIQSHVAYGYVGNRAATLPLQRLGHEVSVINTVQFSNHTGYQKWTGEVFTAAHIENVLDGLESLGALEKMDALLTGYLGDPAIGDIILSVLDRLPKGVRWLCDPVMGDVGRGFFVRPGIPDYFRQKALARASIITPNQFELEYLAGRQILTLDDAKAACRMAHEMGPEIVLLTSLIHDATRDDEIQMLASAKSGEQFLVTTPRLMMDPAPNGAGDCTSALFLGHIVSGAPLGQALSKTASSVFALFEKTLAAGRRELNMIAAQDDFVNPAPLEVVSV